MKKKPTAFEKFDEAMFSTALTIIDNNIHNTEEYKMREKQDTSASSLDEWGKYKLNLYLLQEDTSTARYINIPVVPSTF